MVSATRERIEREAAQEEAEAHTCDCGAKLDNQCPASLDFTACTVCPKTYRWQADDGGWLWVEVPRWWVRGECRG